jgi:hypothetical protein
MKPQMMIPAAALILLPSFANAFPGKVNPSLRLPRTARVQNTTCADFNGHWSGSCNLNGQQDMESTEIQQIGCEVLRMDHEVMVIGGITTEQSTAPWTTNGQYSALTMNRSWSADWNADKTVLNVSYTTQIRGIGGSLPPASVQLNGKVSLQNGKLVTELHGDGQKLLCTFDKQNP